MLELFTVKTGKCYTFLPYSSICHMPQYALLVQQRGHKGLRGFCEDFLANLKSSRNL